MRSIEDPENRAAARCKADRAERGNGETEDLPVTVMDKRTRPAEVDETSTTDLVAKVAHLATCLADGAGRTAAVPAAHREAAAAAVAAARDAERQLAEQLDRLAHLEDLAVTDGLTELLNRRGFEQEFERTLAAAQRHNETGVLAYVDLDGFKPVNDTHGHAAGDKVLRKVGQVLRQNVRDTDFVGRLGGDEFAIVFTRTEWNGGLRRLEQLNRVLNSIQIPVDGRVISVAASIGYHGYGPGDSADTLMRCADEAMYKTKRLRTEHARLKASA